MPPFVSVVCLVVWWSLSTLAGLSLKGKKQTSLCFPWILTKSVLFEGFRCWGHHFATSHKLVSTSSSLLDLWSGFCCPLISFITYLNIFWTFIHLCDASGFRLFIRLFLVLLCITLSQNMFRLGVPRAAVPSDAKSDGPPRILRKHSKHLRTSDYILLNIWIWCVNFTYLFFQLIFTLLFVIFYLHSFRGLLAT